LLLIALFFSRLAELAPAAERKKARCLAGTGPISL